MDTNISLKKKRVMSYFIESAADIMKNQGVNTLTIRNVAEGAGYNSATLYNYFENLDELKEWASISLITEYFDGCCGILEKEIDSLENLYRIWLLYCRYAFHNPQLYCYIFFSSHSADIQKNLRTYSEVFPDWLHRDLSNKRLDRFVNSSNTEERCLYLVDLCIEEGYFRKEDREDINNMASLLSQGLIQELYTYGTNVDEQLIRKALNKFRKYLGEYVELKRIDK